MNSHPPKKLHYTTAYQFYRFGEAKTPAVRTKFIKTFQNIIKERIPQDLDVEITDIQFRNDERLFIELQGKRKADVEFTINVLKELTGQTYEAHNVPKNTQVMGFLRKVGKVGFGLFVDIGIENPYKEVLIPLHVLREQLAGGQTVALSELIKGYGFQENFPLPVNITSIIDPYSRKPKYEARIADPFINQVKEWVSWGLDIIFSIGEARQMVKRTIAKRGHSIDIYEIYRLGPLEMAVICNQGTTGPGLIAHIGKFLPHCRLSTMRAASLQKYWEHEIRELG